MIDQERVATSWLEMLEDPHDLPTPPPAWLTQVELPSQNNGHSPSIQKQGNSVRKKMKRQAKKINIAVQISKGKTRKSLNGREEAAQRWLSAMLDEPCDNDSLMSPSWVVAEEVPKQQNVECSSIQEQANLVRAYIDQNPKSLQSTFKKICKLQKVAAKLQQFTATQKDSASAEENASDYYSIVEEKIKPITNLVADFRRIVQGHVLNCFDLGQRDPSFLTHAVETMSFISENDSRKAVSTKLGGSAINTLRSELSFEEETLVELGFAFDERIRLLFAGYVFQSADSDQSPFDAILGAATNSLVTLVVLQKEIAPCFPQKFDVFNLYKERLEKYMMPQIISLYKTSLDKLEVHELLRLIAWTEQYAYQLSQSDSKVESAFNDELELGLKELMREYTSRVKEQVRQWFANILGRRPEIFSDNEGRLITNDAEDILHIVNMQLLIAKEHLSMMNCQNVLVTCLEELEVMQGLTRMTLETNWKEFELERLCSMVNDTCRLYDKCETFAVDQDLELGLVAQKKTDAVAVGYTELALYVSTVVATSLLDDVSVLLLPNIFSSAWEDGSDILAATVETLRDYFSDLKVWLPRYFFSKCVRCCFEKILQIYVEVALRSDGVFKNSIVAARNIENDRIILLNFFHDEYLVETESSGLRGRALEDRLDVLKAFSKVLLVEDPSDATDACQIIFREIYPDVCPSAILALVGMRKATKESDIRNWESLLEKLKSTPKHSAGAGDRIHYNLHHLLLKDKKQKDLKPFDNSSALIVDFGLRKVLDSPQSSDRGMKNLLNKLTFPIMLQLRSLRTDSSVHGEFSLSTVESLLPKKLKLKSVPVDNSIDGELSVSTVESITTDKLKKTRD